jgi:hypothetical protein
MINFEEKVRERLEKEAAEWIESELEKRMDHAIELIHNQAQDACGEHSYEKHVMKATAYAEEEIRKELEFESNLWIEEELKKRVKTSG